MMTDEFDNRKPRNVLANMDEYMERVRQGIPDVDAQKRERAYRRGWQQGWAYACEVILDRLLSKGESLDEVYRLISRFDSEKVTPWRNRIDSFGTPRFDPDDFPKEQQGQDEEENDA